MIATMIRGKQEDTVESVQDRQVVQGEEEEIKMEEEEMKTENMEGNESNKNISSAASSGASTQKRTTKSANIAQEVSQGWLMTQNRR
jgi:hypothetical protein